MNRDIKCNIKKQNIKCKSITAATTSSRIPQLMDKKSGTIIVKLCDDFNNTFQWKRVSNFDHDGFDYPKREMKPGDFRLCTKIIEMMSSMPPLDYDKQLQMETLYCWLRNVDTLVVPRYVTIWLHSEYCDTEPILSNKLPANIYYRNKLCALHYRRISHYLVQIIVI